MPCAIDLHVARPVGREEMLSTPEPDYRAISQQYAQGGINAVILVNGGAAVAVLSQLGGLKGLADPAAIGWTLICFVIGVFFGLISWVLAFMSTRYVDRFLRGQEASYVRADRYMYAGLLTIACSSGGFLVGCLILAFSYMGQY